MKFNREQLSAALSSACRIVERKSIQPICQNVLVREAKDGAEVIGTNLRTTVLTIVDCEGAGDFCANAHDLLAIVAALDSDDVTVSVKDAGIEISGGGATFELESDKPRDFPSVPSFDGTWTEIDAKALASLLDQTEYAALPFDTRVQLTGVILSAVKGEVEAAATDGHRMAVNRAKMTWPREDACVVPAVVAPSIAKMLDGADKCEIRFAVSSSAKVVQVRVGKSSVCAKLVETIPVPYANFLTDEAWVDDPAIVNRLALIAALKRALSFKGEILKKDGTTDFDVSGDLSVDDGSISIVRKTRGKGFSEKVRTEDNASDGKTARLNLRYLLDGMERLDGESVEVHIKTPLDPVNIRTKDGKQIAIVMPVHP